MSSGVNTQRERIRALLLENGEVSARSLLFEGITRTAARIEELRREGLAIETFYGEAPKGKRPMAQYRLVDWQGTLW